MWDDDGKPHLCVWFPTAKTEAVYVSSGFAQHLKTVESNPQPIRISSKHPDGKNAGSVWFYLDDVKYNDIVDDNIPVAQKQQILSDFFDVVMSLV